MDPLEFPTPPFQRSKVRRLAAAIQAELRRAEAAGEDVDRVSLDLQDRVNEYAATLSEDEATEFLLMYSAELLFLQSEEVLFLQSEEMEASTVPAFDALDDSPQELEIKDTQDRTAAAVGIILGIALVLFVIFRIHSLLS